MVEATAATTSFIMSGMQVITSDKLREIDQFLDNSAANRLSRTALDSTLSSLEDLLRKCQRVDHPTHNDSLDVVRAIYIELLLRQASLQTTTTTSSSLNLLLPPPAPSPSHNLNNTLPPNNIANCIN